jgi:molybdenum cofactor cytidylyltransferase
MTAEACGFRGEFDVVERRQSGVGGIVLAAGLSRRFGGNKLLTPFGGKPLVRWVVEAALSSELTTVVVVLGHEHQNVRAALADLEVRSRLTFVYNDRYEQGQSSSVVAGLSAIETMVEAAMFIPADQPKLDSGVINQLIAAFHGGKSDICYPTVAGERRSPTIFSSRHFPALRQLRGDAGGRSIVDANAGAVTALAFADETPFRDVDDRDEFEALQAETSFAASGRGRPQSLVQWLGLETVRVISICGAGGKTSLMVALVREMSVGGERVLATTTTRMAVAEAEGPWRPREIRGHEHLLAGMDDGPGAILAYQAVDKERGKLIGLAPETIDEVARTGRFDRIIVEADGARHNPLKAPGPNEPVFPSTTGAVVIVVGASGIGKPLDEDTVFRAEAWSALTGLPATRPVTPESVARMVVHPEGLGKGAPRHARRVLFVNQADTQQRREAATQVLDCVFSMSGLVPERAVVGSLQPSPSIQVLRERECSIEANA